MAAEGVGGETNQLNTALGEFRLQTSELAELGSADGSVVLGVGEENDPAVTNELVEVNGAGGGVGLEVGGNRAQTETIEGKYSG